MKFQPIIERTIEAKHAIVKRSLRGLQSPVAASLGNRLPEIQRLLVTTPSALFELATHVDAFRNPLHIANDFRLGDHPSVADREWDAQFWALDPIVRDLFYRCNPEVQHNSMAAQKRQQDKAVGRVAKARKK